MKRTALAVLGIALLLISFTACNPSSNNGPIVLPSGGNTPPSQGQTAQDIANALNIPQLLHNLLINKSGAYDVTYTYSDDIPTSQLATSAGPTEDKDAIIATVTFNQDHELNGVTISSGGKIIYTIIGRNNSNTFTSSADDDCTITTENLKVNGKEMSFKATATINMTASVSSGEDKEVSNAEITLATAKTVTEVKIDGTVVDVTIPENPEGGTDPVEPGTGDDDEEESGGVDGEQAGEHGSPEQEPVS